MKPIKTIFAVIIDDDRRLEIDGSFDLFNDFFQAIRNEPEGRGKGQMPKLSVATDSATDFIEVYNGND